jgi:hypothetical protein
MITIPELCASQPGRSYRSPDVDPFTERDALQEAQLLALRFDLVTSTAALLFELRVALQMRQGNTGVLVATDVRRLVWSGAERLTPLTAWTVGGSVAGIEDSLLRLDLGLWPAPGAQFEMVAGAAAFFVGDVPGLGELPPDYVEDDEQTIRGGGARQLGLAHLNCQRAAVGPAMSRPLELAALSTPPLNGEVGEAERDRKHVDARLMGFVHHRCRRRCLRGARFGAHVGFTPCPHVPSSPSLPSPR